MESLHGTRSVSSPHIRRSISRQIELKVHVSKVVLLPRAFQGAKKSCYNNPPLVYKSLLLLANEYRNMKLGLIEPEEYQKARDVLQIRDGGSIDEDHAGEYGDTYYVRYPIGSSAKRFLEFHLRSRSNTRDPERCLAIYYFWDDETQQVVVGWLPGHDIEYNH